MKYRIVNMQLSLKNPNNATENFLNISESHKFSSLIYELNHARPSQATNPGGMVEA